MKYEDAENIRKILGLKRYQMARLLGVTLRLYYQWTQDGCNPRGSTAVLLRLLGKYPHEIRALIETVTNEQKNFK